MYTAFSPGTKNLFLVLSAACCIVAFFLMDAMRKEQKRRKWVCGILLCILVAMAVAGFHEAKQSDLLYGRGILLYARNRKNAVVKGYKGGGWQ